MPPLHLLLRLLLVLLLLVPLVLVVVEIIPLLRTITSNTHLLLLLMEVYLDRWERLQLSVGALPRRWQGAEPHPTWFQGNTMWARQPAVAGPRIRKLMA